MVPKNNKNAILFKVTIVAEFGFRIFFRLALKVLDLKNIRYFKANFGQIYCLNQVILMHTYDLAFVFQTNKGRSRL